MNINKIKFSIILPAYNVDAFLQKCVETCEMQNINQKEYEIIIVNDGSTDSTLQLAQTLQQSYSNIKILSQNNQGLSMARNNGARIAQGKYLWFIDSDDYISHNCLKDIFEVAESYQLDMFGVAPKIPFIENFPIEFKQSNDLTKVYSGKEWLLSGNAFIGAWAYIIKREFWENTGYQFYPQLYFEDTELMPKLMFKASRLSAFNRFSCYAYVQRDGSIMNSKWTKKKIFDLGRIINSHFDYINTEPEITNNPKLRAIFEHLCSSNYICALSNMKTIEGRKFLDEWLQRLNKKPRKIYGKTFPEKIYQFIAFNFPRLFVSINK